MSLTLPLAFTVGVESLSIPRTQGPDGRTSVFELWRTDGTRLYTAKIDHKVQKNLENHHIILSAQDYDADGLPTRLTSCSVNMRVTGRSQDSTLMMDLYKGLTDNLELTTWKNLVALINREV